MEEYGEKSAGEALDQLFLAELRALTDKQISELIRQFDLLSEPYEES